MALLQELDFELKPPNALKLRQLLDELDSEGLTQRVEALLAG